MIFAIDYWRPVPGSAGYEVSWTGQVRNAATGHPLRPWRHKSGHLYVGLGRSRRAQVHHLVLFAFGEPMPTGMECRHLDGACTNNRRSNLAWGTRKENVDDLKLVSGRYARALVSDEVASEIVRLYTGAHGEQSRLASRFGLTVSIVNRLVNGRTYGHLRA